MSIFVNNTDSIISLLSLKNNYNDVITPSTSSTTSLTSLDNDNNTTINTINDDNDTTNYIHEIKTVEELESSLLELFTKVEKEGLPLSYKLSAIAQMLDHSNFTSKEMNRFTFWSAEKPYTRNCVINNDKFTVLLLCWNANARSSIHDHPCDACFIKVIRGCIKETKYIIDKDKNITPLSNNFHIENQVSYMDNSNILHSISNPNPEVGAVTLHIYTPPFSACKTWTNAGKNVLDDYTVGKIGFFSYLGIRTPHLEGRPSYHARLMSEINSIGCGAGI
jgi:cysteine dioxygenase